VLRSIDGKQVREVLLVHPQKRIISGMMLEICMHFQNVKRIHICVKYGSSQGEQMSILKSLNLTNIMDDDQVVS
jgi:hypothetical protein